MAIPPLSLSGRIPDQIKLPNPEMDAKHLIPDER